MESLWGTCMWDHYGDHVCRIIVEGMYVGSLFIEDMCRIIVEDMCGIIVKDMYMGSLWRTCMWDHCRGHVYGSIIGDMYV